MAISGLQEGFDSFERCESPGKQALTQNLVAVQLSYVVHRDEMCVLPEYRDHLVSVQSMTLEQETLS